MCQSRQYAVNNGSEIHERHALNGKALALGEGPLKNVVKDFSLIFVEDKQKEHFRHSYAVLCCGIFSVVQLF